MHIMVDLETFGTRPGSVIASIGAVAFDPETGEIGRTFYRVISAGSAQAAGLEIDAETVTWWLKQGDAARLALTCKGTPLALALQEFAFWWAQEGGRQFWSHGANFDEPMLAAAYRAVGQRTPWSYSASRCSRTILHLTDVAIDRSAGDHHNALDDALAQAQAVCQAYRKLGLTLIAEARAL